MSTKIADAVLKGLEKLETSGIDVSTIKIERTEEIMAWKYVYEKYNSSIKDYFVTIYLHDEFGENPEYKEEIGYLRASFISERHPLFETPVNMQIPSDDESLDFFEAVYAVTDENGQLDRDRFEVYGDGVLYVKNFSIKPEYRSKGVGFVVFPAILNALQGSAAFIGIVPDPDFDGWDEDLNDESVLAEKKKAMCRFIEQFGFECLDEENSVWIKNTAYI